MIVEGGDRILTKLQGVRGDVFTRRPQLRGSDWIYMLLRALGSR